MKKDFFSVQSDVYAKYRPTYPQALYDYILDLVNDKKLTWDAATGNGQAAFHLAQYFERIHASDISEKQLKHAKKRDNISYHLEPSEKSSLKNNSVDLITVATAIHWFDKTKFFQEVDRVLKKNGVLFVWSYGGCKINESVDQVIDYFNFEFLLDYWHEGAKENWHDKYQSLQMPYTLIQTPPFIAAANYTLEETMMYMYSWSGVQTYIKEVGRNPLDAIKEDLIKAWGNPLERKEIKWHLHSKCCRK